MIHKQRWYKRLYYVLIENLLQCVIKSKVIPLSPTKTLNLDPTAPVLYILPSHSMADLLTLRIICRKLALPDPLQSLDFDSNQLPGALFIHEGSKLFGQQIHQHQYRTASAAILQRYLQLHRDQPALNVQLLPVSIMFGRYPVRGKKQPAPYLRLLNGWQKFWAILWLGRDSFVRFSPKVSLRYIADEYGTDTQIAHKLARVAYIHFSRQQLATIGPKILSQKEIMRTILAAKSVEKVLVDRAKQKGVSYQKVEKKAVAIVQEIAAKFSYEMLRVTDRVLGWTWQRLYQRIEVHNIAPVLKLAQEGHELVYLPCHRSHMDYLLLSYLIYHQGLAPPYIAAGLNLNFWPAGMIFRRLGAFFIRRSFKSDKLYSAIFREYLSELFTHGYAVEYFIEGGRSRNGRLLPPKTGTLSMTIQTLLRGVKRPITLVPIYIGYEHVLEVSTYAKERHGATKKKENVWQMLRGFAKLRQLGAGYVNFGEPITLNSYLNQHVPCWNELINPIDVPKPSWLNSVTANIADQVMVQINRASVLNSVNLCATALLSVPQHALTRLQLVKQIDFYLQLQHDAPYSETVILPENDATSLIDAAFKLHKIKITKDVLGESIFLSPDDAVLMAYYRNNIQHLFILPALLAAIILVTPNATLAQITVKVVLLYPLFKSFFFLPEMTETLLQARLEALLNTLHAQQLVEVHDGVWRNSEIDGPFISRLGLLATEINESMQYYGIVIFLLLKVQDKSRHNIEKKAKLLSERLTVLHGSNLFAEFDRTQIAQVLIVLRSQGGYFNQQGEVIAKSLTALYDVVLSLLPPAIRNEMTALLPEKI